MYFRTLTVLMWKHTLARKNEIFSTLIEFVFPVLPFFLIFVVRKQLFPVIRSSGLATFNEPTSLRSIPGPPCVLYTPDTSFTSVLMDLVAWKLDLQRLKILSRKTSVRGYFPFNNASTIFEYSKNMGSDEAVVEFHNITKHTWPDSLSYSIRMKIPLEIRERFNYYLYDYDSSLSSHKQYDTDDGPFMRLQWAIDTSFIEIQTGEEVEQNVTIRKLNHPPVTPRSSHLYAIKANLLFIASGLSILPAFYTLMMRMLTEKDSGVQELMKMMGVTTSTLFISHVLNVLLPGLVYSGGVTAMLKVKPSPILENSNAFLIFLALFLQFAFTISAATICSDLARKASPTSLTVLSIYILLSLPSFIWNGMNVSQVMIYPLGFLPFMPLAWIFKEASILEDIGPGLTLKTMMVSHTITTGTALVAYIYFILHIIIGLVMFWYLDRVMPTIYGTTHPWNFPFKKSYWFKPTENADIEEKKSEKQEKPETLIYDQQYFETPPKHLEAGIKIMNVTKDYTMHRALDNFSLDVYKGEITILLGHNGAGKSTLISIITGMMNPTKGKVLVNGLDISSKTALVRQHIGLCPQQDMFFENITVLEHVMFFALLNKGTFKEARISSENLLDKLHLKNKAKNSISVLSGGMKRRLQLACALAGDAPVLLLDEPTSGIDVETRCSMWDLLLTLRKSRTVLLSTHFMEEADALGDRVAALVNGQLRCHATPIYLKRAIGSGYRLTFITKGMPNEAAITPLLKSVIPEITVKETGFNSISYNLPSASTKIFPSLFTKLESERSKYGIDSIGVGTSTLEEVFMKICSDVDTGLNADNEIQKRKAPNYKMLTGWPLLFRQSKALLKRYFRFLWSNKVTQLGFGSMRVIILILVITFVTNDAEKKPEMGIVLLAMNFDMNKPLTDYIILYNIDGPDSDLRPLSDLYPRVHFERASNISEAVLRTTRQDKIEYRNYLAGIELDDKKAELTYTTKVQNTAPAVLNLMSNLIATRALPSADGDMITTYKHPIQLAYMPDNPNIIREPKSFTNITLWTFSITLMLLSGIVFMIQLPCKETTDARHIHVLAGCSPELHWITTLMAATFQVLVTYNVAFVIACMYLDYDNTFTDKYFIIAASTVVLLGSMAMLAFSYKITLHVPQSLAVGIITSIIVFFELIFYTILEIVPATEYFEPVVLIAITPYTFNEAIEDCTTTAYLNRLCELNQDKCPTMAIPVPNFDAEKCCASKSNPWCYFCFQKPAPGKKIIYLIVQIFVYMILVILTQRGLFSVLWKHTANFSYKPPASRCNDKAVIEERMYVEKTIKLPPKQIPDIILVSNLHLKYQHCCKSYKAVKGISFSIKKGECFGLLGGNGAGKSSMFRMLTAEQCPTRGHILVNGHEMMFPYSTKYLHSLAYCPQFWGLNEFLTGRQSLELLLALKGYNARDSNTEAMNWINLVGLEKYTDQVVSSYSGGCLRRIAAAAALCTGAPVTLLDEPTAGVDVAARRRVWYALKRGLRDHHAIIINSHSLDEMEALCHRISIMSNGEICALGSSASLRAAHSSGHSVILKVNYEPPVEQKKGVPGATNLRVDKLKAAIEKRFKCTLRDEHKTMLHYHINEIMHYSELFQEMELLKATFRGLIEDYTVSETTLEEVFLSIVKPKKEPSISDEKRHKNRRDVASQRP